MCRITGARSNTPAPHSDAKNLNSKKAFRQKGYAENCNKATTPQSSAPKEIPQNKSSVLYKISSYSNQTVAIPIERKFDLKKESCNLDNSESSNDGCSFSVLGKHTFVGEDIEVLQEEHKESPQTAYQNKDAANTKNQIAKNSMFANILRKKKPWKMKCAQVDQAENKNSQIKKDGNYRLRNRSERKALDLPGLENSNKGEAIQECREIKKQILLELMRINNIPASYFLLGNDSAGSAIDIGINEIVGMVDIFTNEKGEITVQPKRNEICTTDCSVFGEKMQQNKNSLPIDAYSRAISIRKMRILEKKGEAHLKRTATSCGGHRGKRVIIPLTQETNVSFSGCSSKPPRSVSTKSRNIKQTKFIPLFCKTNGSPGSARKGKRTLIPLQNKNGQKKIKIWHEPDNHLVNHTINCTFRLINEITLAIFRTKEETYDQHTIFNLCKKLSNVTIISKSQLSNSRFYEKQRKFICN